MLVLSGARKRSTSRLRDLPVVIKEDGNLYWNDREFGQG